MKFTGERLTAEIPKTDGLYKEHMQRYVFAKEFIKKGDVVLDVACGTGYGTNYLASNANEPKKVYGVDICSEAIEYAKNNYHRENTIFFQQNALQLDLPESSFDVICSFETIEHLSEGERFLREIKRLLKPNGFLIISTPNRETYSGGQSLNTFHKKEFSLSEILKLLNRHYREIAIYGQKMVYFTRPYKKLRLLLRYPSSNLRKKIVRRILKKFKTIERTPRFLRIFLYEWEYPYTVLAQFENDRKIKPTFFIFTCRK